MNWLAPLLLVLVAATPLPGAMTEGLAWDFEHASSRDGPRTEHRYQSVAPVADRTYLGFHVTVTDFETATQAGKAFDDLVRRADPNTGLSYAWDTALLDDRSLLHLAAPCLFSADNYALLERNLRSTLNGEPLRSLRCRCGMGCTFEGGPTVRIHRLDHDGVDSDRLHEQIVHVFDDAGWQVVDGDADHEVTPRVRPAGFKSVLELTMTGPDGDAEQKVTTGASTYVMHEVAGELALELLEERRQAAPE